MKRAFLFAGLLAATFATSALAEDRVLVIPFGTLNVPESQRWIAKGAFENLVADLGRSGKFTPIAFGGQVIVEDNATAARLAPNAEAPLAVRGSAQVVGDQVRLTAQLIDSRTGDTIRTALVTGAAPDLLKMEDDLAGQIRGVPQAAAPAQAAATPTAPVVVSQPPIIVINQPQPYYYPYDSGYAYAGYASYPYYNYGTWPILLYTVNNGHRDHGDHNHGNGDPGHGTGHSGGTGGGTPVVHNDPTGLPIPSGNVLPIPSGGVLPIPTNNVQPNPTAGTLVPVMTHSNSPLPSSGALPVPNHSVATPLPTSNAGVNRNPKLVN